MISSHLVPTIPASVGRNHSGGTVSAPHESEVQAGEAMLAQGGNAVDAAVAAALVAGVVEPTETTLGGSGFMLIGDSEGKVISVEFGPRAPLAANPEMFELDLDAPASNVLGLAPVIGNANVDGPLASGVPRTLVSLLAAHARFGNLPRRTVMDPAIRAAEEGFAADPWFVLNALSDRERLGADGVARQTFLDSAGIPIGSGRQGFYGASVDGYERVKQPLLAQTLDRIADEGPESFVNGGIADDLAETFAEAGMILTREDLAFAMPEVKTPLSVAFRDRRVHVPTAPGGGMTELQILKIWSHIYPSGSPCEDTPERIRALALAMRHAFADRYHWLGDPDVVPVPMDEMLSDQYASRLATACLSDEVPEEFSNGTLPWAHFSASPLHFPGETTGKLPKWRPGGATTPTSGTTHISAADNSGTFVAITHTAANHFGSGVICPRTGLLLDSAMAWFNATPGAANSIRSGARPLANMGPVIVSDHGSTLAAVGASGGRRIIGAVSQIVIDLVDRRRTPLETLQSPRIDASGPNIVLHEMLAPVRDVLADLLPVVIPATSTYFALDFARANLAARTEEGGVQSAIDAQSYSHS